MQINQTEIELGNAIEANIIARNINTRLSLIDLAKLKNHFGLDVIESGTRLENNNTLQSLRLKLYPRNTSVHQIPTISLAEYSTSPVSIKVIPAKTVNGTVSFESHYEPTSLWQRQQLTLTASITTPSKFARIEIDDFAQAGIEAYKIPTTTVKLDNGQYKLTSGWHLYPLTAGKHHLFPPSVNYRLSGKIQRRFFPDDISINVKQLPSYIPPLMPVGKLSIDSHVTPDNTWDIRFSSTKILPTTLASLSVPLTNIADITFGEVTSDLVENNYYQHLPLQFKHSGLYTLPEFSIKYFNPENGKIEAQHSSEITVLFIAPWLKIVLLLIVAFILYKLIILVINKISAIIVHKKIKNRIIHRSLNARSPYELHDILKQYAAHLRWGNNLPLSRWLTCWSEHYSDCSANEIINELSIACYAKNREKNTQDILNNKIYNLLLCK